MIVINHHQIASPKLITHPTKETLMEAKMVYAAGEMIEGAVHNKAINLRTSAHE